MPGVLNVEVVYALPQRQELVRLKVAEGATARDAIEASEVLARFPEIDLDKVNKVGVFGKLVRLDTVLRERDRVEIYRPLIADPKEARKRRADEGKALKKGGGPAQD